MDDEEEMARLGPFTLEEAKEWLHRLEDIATLERDMGFASRFVLLNLFKLLAGSGTINGPAFIEYLRQGIPLMDAANERLATDVLLADLADALRPEDVEGPALSKRLH